MATLWYTVNGGSDRPRKKEQTMAPETTIQETPTVGKPVTKTVFDLSIFDDVKLTKTVQLPSPVQSVEEALAAVGNDSAALLAVINDGLAERAVEAAKKDLSGFTVAEEIGDFKAGDAYNGKFAEGDKSKQINASVLNLAKAMNSAWDTLSADAKRTAKAAVIEMLRQNPAFLAGLQS